MRRSQNPSITDHLESRGRSFQAIECFPDFEYIYDYMMVFVGHVSCFLFLPALVGTLYTFPGEIRHMKGLGASNSGIAELDRLASTPV